jgi:hypothetical protein
MSFINHQAKRIHCKIVYYGPSLGGKTTNMQWVYNQVAAGGEKSDLFSLPTDVERTLFFDFLPLNVGAVSKPASTCTRSPAKSFTTHFAAR